MKYIENKTRIRIAEKWDNEVIKRVKGVKWFHTTWWETLSSTCLGKDIHIETEDEIRNIYLNGKLLTNNKK